MLSNEDHPGLFTFLIGIIAVVMAAVGLSLVADTKFSVSRGPRALTKELETAAEELQRLTDHHGALARRLGQAEEETAADQATQARLRSEVTAQTRHLATLAESRAQLQQAIPTLEEEFRDYRADYRKNTWDQAVGQKLGTLKVRGGREYRQAVIKRVTEVGLEIDHAEGMARIQAPDLDPAIRDRFQWDDEERRQRLKEERDHQRAVTGGSLPSPLSKPAAKPTPATPGTPAAAPVPDQLKRLRAAEALARAKVERITTQLRDARAAAASGQNSVPGTLETWRSRIARLEAGLTTANAELALARANLAAAAAPPPMP